MPGTIPLILILTASNSISAQAVAVSASDIAKLETSFAIIIATTELRFPVETKHGLIDGKTAGPGKVKDYVRVFAPEFALYPPELVQRARLRRIVLCTDLTFAGQRRNAIPDFEHGTLYLDVARGTHDWKYLRKVIHHEFFHIIDFRDDGSLYRDDHWSALNPPGFEYGDGGRNAQNHRETSLLTQKFPGFLNHYSTTGVEEDKAEVFANMMVDFEHVEVRSQSDKLIHDKRAAMQKLLSKFSPAMDESFWRKVRDMKRNDD
jgi:hypothetical protein